MFTREQFLIFCSKHGISPDIEPSSSPQQLYRMMIEVTLLACEAVEKLEAAEQQPRPKLGLNGVRPSRASP